VVVLDVIRASNTVIAALHAGAGAVHLARGLDEARALAERHPGWLLWGERGGEMVPGFAGDNSPAQALSQDLAGRTVVLTTTNGVPTILAARGAETVLVGSLANASALLEALARLAPPAVRLLAAGKSGGRAPEDEMVADYLAARLQGRPADGPGLARELRGLASADELRRLKQDDDLACCTALDCTTVVPRVDFAETARAVRHAGGPRGKGESPCRMSA
jgi:2-phosphosulfolactate phosphatase